MQAHDMFEFTDPWRVCPSCHQVYQNEFGIDIASEFVSFVRRQYPQDTQSQVEALYVKLRALNSMFGRLQPRQKRELGVTANVLLSLIDRMRNDAPQTRRYSHCEAGAYSTRGCIALDEGTEESARRAVVHLKKALEVYEGIGDDEGIATAKASIAITKSKYEGGSNEEMLKASRELYELRIAEDGDGNEITILAGKNYAIALLKVDCVEEAMGLFDKLLAMSKQVFGPHHNTTKELQSTLDMVVAECKQL
jgi:hypothetical protein